MRLLATAGQAVDSPQALPLLAGLELGKALAGTAYASDATRAYCAERGIEAWFLCTPIALICCC